MGKSSPPPPPDPQETAAAQTATNIGTAIANTNLGQVNQFTPWGNLTYTRRESADYDPNYVAPDIVEVTGQSTPGTPDIPQYLPGSEGAVNPDYVAPGNGGTTYRVDDQTFNSREEAQDYVDGLAPQQYETYTYVDPNSNEVYEIPLYDAVTSLNEDQQGALDAQQDAALTLSETARDQATFLQGYLGEGIQTDDLPGPVTSEDVGDLNLRNRFRVGRNVTRNVRGGRIQDGIESAGNVRRNVEGGQYRRGFNDGGNVRGNFAAGGNVRRNFNDGGNVQGRFNSGGNVRSGFNSGGDITRSYGTDANRSRERVEDALMQRLNRQFGQDEEALQQRLANQGIAVGSEAYQREMDQFGRQRDDARLGAILAGGQEQSRIAGLNRDRASFENQAQAQGFSQNAAQAAFANQAQSQRFGQNQAQAQFANQAQAQRFGQNAAQAAFANQAQAQQFGQNQARADFANQAQAQRFGQNQAQAQFANDATAAQFGQNLAQQNFRNEAQAQQFAQNDAQRLAANQAQALEFEQGMQNANLRNQVQQQRFGQNQALASFDNSARTAEYNARMGGASMDNNLRNQMLEERFALRNQPINEIAALLSGSQIQNPNFTPAQPAQIPTTDYAGIVSDNYNQQLNAWNAQNANSQSLMGGLLGLGGNLGAAGISAGWFSDRRLKRDIERVGEVDGLNVYEYQYIWGGPRHRGFMAQEVISVKPEAVGVVAGFLALDYAKLPNPEAAA